MKSLFFLFLFLSFFFLNFISAEMGYGNGDNVEFGYGDYPTPTINYTTLSVNETKFWNTNEGVLDNVIDILGSWLTNDLNWVNETQIDGQINSTSWRRSGTDVFLTNSGDKVGIGTNSPLQNLHVYDSSTAYLNIEGYTDDAHLRLWSNSDGLGGEKSIIEFIDDGVIKWVLGKSRIDNKFTLDNELRDVMTIEDGGNMFLMEDGGYVGIGTTSPSHELNVVGDVNVTENIVIGGNINHQGNITNPVDENWGYFNNGTCIVIGNLSYISEC